MTQNITHFAPVVLLGNTHQHRLTVLAKTDTNCHFTGTIPKLECPNSSVESGQPIDAIQIIRHPVSVTEKHLKKIMKDQGNPSTLLYIARTYDTLENYTEAIKYYHKRTLIEDKCYEELSYAHYRIGACELALNSTHFREEARNHLIYSYNIDPYRLEPLYYLARIERERGNYTQCLMYTSAGMMVKFPWPKSLYLEVPIYKWALQEEYATCLYYTGRSNDAKYYWKDLLKRSEQLGIPQDSVERIKKNIQF